MSWVFDQVFDLMFRLIGDGCFIFMFLMSWVAIFAGLHQMWRYRDAHKWPHCTGQLISLEVKKHVYYSQNGGRRTYWTLEADYTYEVDGIKHRSQSVGVSDAEWFSQRRALKAKKQVEHFGKGKRRVRVYYDPENPAACMILRNGHFNSIFTVLAGLLAASVFGWLLFLGFSRSLV